MFLESAIRHVSSNQNNLNQTIPQFPIYVIEDLRWHGFIVESDFGELKKFTLCFDFFLTNFYLENPTAAAIIAFIIAVFAALIGVSFPVHFLSKFLRQYYFKKSWIRVQLLKKMRYLLVFQVVFTYDRFITARDRAYCSPPSLIERCDSSPAIAVQFV